MSCSQPGPREGRFYIELVRVNGYLGRIVETPAENLVMNVSNFLNTRTARNTANTVGVLLMAFFMLLMAGCISSSRSYTADKNIVYKGSLYNMSNVKTVTANVTGQLPNGDVKNMKGMDKKAVQALLDESSPVMVTTALDLDGQEMVYERRSVSKYSDYSKMMSNFESAGKKVTKFMANKKSTQLKL